MLYDKYGAKNEIYSTDLIPPTQFVKWFFCFFQEIVEYLVENGADIKKPNFNGNE